MIRHYLKLLLALAPLLVFDLPAGCMRGQDAVFSAADQARWSDTRILVVEDFIPVALGCCRNDNAAVTGEATDRHGQRLRFLMCCSSARRGYCQIMFITPLP